MKVCSTGYLMTLIWYLKFGTFFTMNRVKQYGM